MSASRWPERRLLAVLCIALGSGIPTVHATDLLQAYYQALEKDPAYTEASFEFEAMKEKVPEARSALLPSASVSGSSGLTAGNTAFTMTPKVNRGFGSYQWEVQLTQPIFRIDDWLALDQAHLAADQSMSQFMLAKQDLILRVAQAYFDVLVAQETVSVAEAQLKALQEQLSVAQHSFDKGVAAITDVDEGKTREGLARSQHEAAIDDLNDKASKLESILGSLPESLAPLRDGVVVPKPQPDDVEAWVQTARDRNYAVLAARAQVQAELLQVRRVHDQRYPNVDLVATYGHNYSDGNITDPNDFGTRASSGQLGIQLSMPIFDGGGLHAEVVEAKARARKAGAALDLARRQAVLDVRTAFSGINSDMTQIEALEISVRSGASALRGNFIGYGLGIRINSDVLNAEQQLFQARRDLARSRYDVLLQGLRLKAATGTLGVGDLMAINTMLATGASK